MGDLLGFFVGAPGESGDPVTGHYYEMASADPFRAQVWGYTDRISHGPGEVLRLHVMSSAPEVSVRIEWDGLVPVVVHQAVVPGGFAATPPDCSVVGCGWPERLAMVITRGRPVGLRRKSRGVGSVSRWGSRSRSVSSFIVVLAG